MSAALESAIRDAFPGDDPKTSLLRVALLRVLNAGRNVEICLDEVTHWLNAAADDPLGTLEESFLGDWTHITALKLQHLQNELERSSRTFTVIRHQWDRQRQEAIAHGVRGPHRATGTDGLDGTAGDPQAPF